MNNNFRQYVTIIAMIVVSSVLTGCGGTKVLKEPQPVQLENPLAVTADARMTATLDWVIVRAGPGTWAKNADWDEYLLRVRNHSDRTLRIVGLTVVDSLQTRIESGAILSGSTSTTAAGTAMSGLVFLGPAIAVGGIMRAANNSAVNTEMEKRQTILPLDVPPGQELSLDVFFPLAPSPVMIELVYADDAGRRHTVAIDTRAVLDGLHFDENVEQT